MKRLCVVICLLVSCMELSAQEERKLIRKGNDLFKSENYENAVTEYMRAQDIKNNSFEAKFNLADALYKQKKYDEALSNFRSLAETETDKSKLGAVYHNIGNTLLANQKIEESIEAYKQSLRNNPTSQETKYNLEFARKMLQKQQQQQQQQQQQNKDQQNKDQQNQNNQEQDKQNQDKQNQDKQNQDKQNQDKQNQDKQNQDQKDKQDQSKQDKDKQNQDKQNRNKQNQNGQQGEQQEAKISKEDAERLLEALQADEKAVQEKVQKSKEKAKKAKKVGIEKQW